MPGTFNKAGLSVCCTSRRRLASLLLRFAILLLFAKCPAIVERRSLNIDFSPLLSPGRERDALHGKLNTH